MIENSWARLRLRPMISRAAVKGAKHMKSKAMVLVEPGRLELREFEVRPPAPEEILTKSSQKNALANK